MVRAEAYEVSTLVKSAVNNGTEIIAEGLILRNKELHASGLSEDADSPTRIFAELPVGFRCRVPGYSFFWTIRVATGEVGG